MIDTERLNSLRSAIRESGDYSFDRYCTEHDLYRKGKELKAGGVWIACPFHGDLSPSLSFNEERGIWHCFGCGAGGNLIDFMYDYETKVLNRELSKSAYLNELLRENSALQLSLGFSTILKNDHLTLESLEPLQKQKISVRGGEMNLCELQEKFLHKKPNRAEIHFFISLMQSGLTVREIQAALNGEKCKEGVVDFSSTEFSD